MRRGWQEEEQRGPSVRHKLKSCLPNSMVPRSFDDYDEKMNDYFLQRSGRTDVVMELCRGAMLCLALVGEGGWVERRRRRQNNSVFFDDAIDLYLKVVVDVA